MNGFLESCRLELRRLRRSWTLPSLLAASLAIIFLMPRFLSGDGTVEGLRALCIRYSLGAVFALLMLSLGASAAGSIASDRLAHRLQLALTRPISRFAFVAGRLAALTLAGSLTLAVASAALCAVLWCGAGRNLPPPGPCAEVVRPLLEDSLEVAKRRYAEMRANPEASEESRALAKRFAAKDMTPEAAKILEAASIRWLAKEEESRYDLITNTVAVWRFPDLADRSERPLAVRVAALRAGDGFAGEFSLGSRRARVASLSRRFTVAALVPDDAPVDEELRLERTAGKEALVINPREQLAVMVRSDSFCWNLFRAWLQLTSALAFALSIALLAGSLAGRPVAVFAVMSILVLAELAPVGSVGYTSEHPTAGEKWNLMLTKFSAAVTAPIGTLDPLTPLSEGEAIPWGETAMRLARDGVAIPALLLVATAIIVGVKPDEC